MSCYKYLHCKRKTNVSYYYLTRKTKVSYYITFFQTLLKTFSRGLCYSDRRIVLSYCEKRKVNYFVCMKNQRVTTLQYFQRTTKVSCSKYLHCREQTKVSYYIRLRENKSIILHHVLLNSSENIFLWPLLF